MGGGVGVWECVRHTTLRFPLKTKNHHPIIPSSKPLYANIEKHLTQHLAQLQRSSTINKMKPANRLKKSSKEKRTKQHGQKIPRPGVVPRNSGMQRILLVYCATSANLFTTYLQIIIFKAFPCEILPLDKITLTCLVTCSYLHCHT